MTQNWLERNISWLPCVICHSLYVHVTWGLTGNVSLQSILCHAGWKVAREVMLTLKVEWQSMAHFFHKSKLLLDYCHLVAVTGITNHTECSIYSLLPDDCTRSTLDFISAWALTLVESLLFGLTQTYLIKYKSTSKNS